MNAESKTIAVLGAGVAGLAAAKALAQHGFDVTVYETRSELGGVWANNYRSLRVLEPKSGDVFAFVVIACGIHGPDYPFETADADAAIARSGTSFLHQVQISAQGR